MRAALAFAALWAACPAAQEPQREELPAELDLSQVDTDAARPWQFHGRLDLAFVHFPEKQNVDDHRHDQVLPLSPGVYGEYRFADWLAVVAELEYDGREEKIEIDQALLRADFLAGLVTLKVGRSYVPFGIERRSYSPSRNLLVDRPAVHRVVYPGTYADLGGFLEGRWQHSDGWALGWEAALVEGLRGFDHEAVPRTFEDKNQSPAGAGRISFSPFAELTLGASAYAGAWDDDGRSVLDFYGVDLAAQFLGLSVRAEYLLGRIEDAPGQGDLLRHGGYVHLEREIELELPLLHALTPVARYDWIDADRSRRDFLDLSRYSVGLVFGFRRDLMLKLELSVSDERGREIDNNGFLAQVVYWW